MIADYVKYTSCKQGANENMTTVTATKTKKISLKSH